MLLVPKQDGSFRPVVDYRKLNSMTVPDHFPVPNITLLLQDIGQGKCIFSTIDLKSGYNQVDLEDKAKEMTAFSTPEGHFQFLKMPFGLRNAPITFCRLMSIILAGLIGETVWVYLDDLLIASRTKEEHEGQLRKVFKKLAEANLVINIKKSYFFRKCVKFLGHTLDMQGIGTNDGKVKDIVNFPVPTNVKKVKSFLGMSGFYRKYIPGYGSIAKPLAMLLKKDMTFEWGESQQQAFEELKHRLTHAPVLIFPDFLRPFYLATDASSVGLGAALMQRDPSGVGMQPIGYASRKIDGPELNYSATDLEALGVVWALQHFRETILGYQITVMTDHQPLTSLLAESKDTRGRMARWVTTILEFNPKIVYFPGAGNHVADALSRMSTIHLIDHLDVLDLEQVKEEQRKDNTLGPIIDFLEGRLRTRPTSREWKVKELFLRDNLLFRDSRPKKVRGDKQKHSYTQLVIPEPLVKIILQQVHECQDAAHAGVDKAIQMARRKYFFPRMGPRIADHVKSCQLCPFYKGGTKKPAPALQYNIPDRPFQRVHVDVLAGFTTTERSTRYLLVFVDAFSRWCELVPVADKSAIAIARAFLDNIVNRHQTPKELVSDNGTEFTNQVLT